MRLSHEQWVSWCCVVVLDGRAANVVEFARSCWLGTAESQPRRVVSREVHEQLNEFLLSALPLWPAERRLRVDAALRAEGLPTLDEVVRRFPFEFRQALRRGKITTLDEHFRLLDRVDREPHSIPPDERLRIRRLLARSRFHPTPAKRVVAPGEMTDAQWVEWATIASHRRLDRKIFALVNQQIAHPPEGISCSQLVRAYRGSVNEFFAEGIDVRPRWINRKLDALFAHRGLPSLLTMWGVTKKILPRVLKRGRVVSNEEFEHLTDVLTDVDAAVTAAERRKLEGMLVRFEQRSR